MPLPSVFPLFDSSLGRTRTPLAQPAVLPMSRAEMDRLGWQELDVLLVTGDAYVDHPSFGMALLGRLLVAHGYRAGIVAQPRWDGPDDISRLGRPRLFCGVTAGALDSMLAHYTAFRKKRHDDAYTPGGKAGARPNRASIVYANLVRRAFPGLPLVLGGIEASLRRVVHFDFWEDKLRRSLLLDAKADLIAYGMAERQMLEIASRVDAALADGLDPRSVLRGVPGTVFACREDELADVLPGDAEVARLPSLDEIAADPPRLVAATMELERQVHGGTGYAVQPDGPRLVVCAPPAPRLTQAEMDALYALPFSRRAHPSNKEQVPAEAMIRESLTTHRGCGGGCSFCSLALHQGRRISSRSRDGVLAEAERLAAAPWFKGSVSDVGGPTANMWGAECALPEGAECRRESCMVPKVCRHFRVDQAACVETLRDIRDLPGVRHVRVASGVRYDLGLAEPKALSAYVREFVGGQLKVAPEHIADHVLSAMRKPSFAVFERFLDLFARESGRAAKEQYVVPYLMSGFPGCSDEDMRRLGAWLAGRGWKPQQVQCFIPTPGTVATAMFYAGTDATGRKLPMARSDAERLRQHAVLMPETGRPPAKGRGGGRHAGGSGKGGPRRPKR